MYLISDNIIRREQYDEIPPKVEYSLTDKGKSVVPILQSICRWSGAYHKNESEHIMAQCRNVITTMNKMTYTSFYSAFCRIGESNKFYRNSSLKIEKMLLIFQR